MKCPRCEAPDMAVTDSRPAAGDTAVRRRRRCHNCDHRMTTIETEMAEHRRSSANQDREEDMLRLLPRLDPQDAEMVLQMTRRLAEDEPAAEVIPMFRRHAIGGNA